MLTKPNYPAPLLDGRRPYYTLRRGGLVVIHRCPPLDTAQAVASVVWPLEIYGGVLIE